MTHENDSEQKQVWPKRAPCQRQLFASVDKWLACLPYLSKPELDKCREVCEWTDWLIEKHSGGRLKQRRQLFGLTITTDPATIPDLEMAPLDMDKWMEEEEEEMEKIKVGLERFRDGSNQLEPSAPSIFQAKAKELIGEIIYPYEPEDATVRIEIEPGDQIFYLNVKNRLDEKDALLIARLVPRIIPPTAVFRNVWFQFESTPELPADAPRGGSYINPALFSLPSNEDGSGGGPVKLITRELTILGVGGSERGGIRTAEQAVQCQVLYEFCDSDDAIHFLRQVAVARPLNAPAWMDADTMEDGRLDEMLNFFTHTVPGFESAASRLRVTIDHLTTWPESLPKESAINPREEQLAERLYKFRRHNHETGERLEVEVRGSFGNTEDEGKGEDGLRVAQMVLHFRPDDADK